MLKCCVIINNGFKVLLSYCSPSSPTAPKFLEIFDYRFQLIFDFRFSIFDPPPAHSHRSVLDSFGLPPGIAVRARAPSVRLFLELGSLSTPIQNLPYTILGFERIPAMRIGFQSGIPGRDSQRTFLIAVR